jgi:cyclase
MLKKRIIPLILLKDERIVKGKNFTGHIPVGNAISMVKVYISQCADEILLIDISEKNNTSILSLIKEASCNCNVPFTVGGKIKNVDYIRELLLSGADKVLVTSEATNNINFIKESAKIYGSQCIIVGLDYKKIDNKYKVFSKSGLLETSLDFSEYVEKLQDFGAGEILLNSIDRDGMMTGYDLELINDVSSKLRIPVIACGGAGSFDHIEDLFKKTKASAAACASIFNFSDNNPFRLRAYLKNKGIPVREL